MNKIKKIVISSVLAVAVVFTSVVSASAASLSASSKKFDEKWELYATSSDGKANLTYGYNS